MNNTLSSGNEPVAIRIGVDIGGTFTDGVAQMVGQGRILTAKELTDVVDPSRGVALVVSKLLDQTRRALGQGADIRTQEVVHGTTLVTNAILERKGVKTGLVVTRGTGDALQIAREIRYDMYDIDIELPEPLVPRTAVLTVGGRLDASGNELQPITPEMLDVLADEVEALGVESIGICTLHSYIAPVHEERIAAHLRKRFPELSISMSSRVAPEPREYERMSTVAANAYVQPIAEIYLRKLQDSLKEVGASSPLNIMVSSGGFTSVRSAADVPIVLLESGPAGGVLGALNTAAAVGVCDVLTFDMGGTTAKACVARDGVPSITFLFEAARARRFKKGSGLPILVPSIDLIEIGAGGGSIAHRSVLGLLNVGPQSAGASPGPACYGQGGVEPTVTDADLLLGYLDPDNFLGGRMKLHKDLARQAMDNLGAKLSLSGDEVAIGICDIVNENMASAARVHVAEKGMDPRSLTMLATGGAGPVHAIEVARKLGIRRVLCGIAAGVGSCLGFLAAPARADRAWARAQPLADVDKSELSAAVGQMRESAIEELSAAGVEAADMAFVLSADMRYLGQGHPISVESVLEDGADVEPAGFAALFTERYAALYGKTVPGGVEQVMAWRLSGRSKKATQAFHLHAVHGNEDIEPVALRSIYLPDERAFSEVPVFDRYALPAGAQLDGPLLLQEPESTIVVARRARVDVLADLTVSITLL